MLHKTKLNNMIKLIVGSFSLFLSVLKYALNGIFWSKNITKQWKKNIYNTYGSETWVINEHDERKNLAIEMDDPILSLLLFTIKQTVKVMSLQDGLCFFVTLQFWRKKPNLAVISEIYDFHISHKSCFLSTKLIRKYQLKDF